MAPTMHEQPHIFNSAHLPMRLHQVKTICGDALTKPRQDRPMHESSNRLCVQGPCIHIDLNLHRNSGHAQESSVICNISLSLNHFLQSPWHGLKQVSKGIL